MMYNFHDLPRMCSILCDKLMMNELFWFMICTVYVETTPDKFKGKPDLQQQKSYAFMIIHFDPPPNVIFDWQQNCEIPPVNVS